MMRLSFTRQSVALVGLAFALLGLALLVTLQWPPSYLAARVVRVVRRIIFKLDWVDPDRRAPSGTQYQTFFSPTVQRKVSYLIYLPPGYASATRERYPVIYWLHSNGGSQREGADVFVPGLDAAIRSGEVPATIVVLPNGMGASRWLDSPEGKRPVETVIVRDLIPHIDSSYRTIADRRSRAVEGFSMGGFGAAHLGFKFPEVFGVVSMFSAALFDASNDPEFLEATSPWKLVVRNEAAIRGRTQIRMIVGDQETLLELNRKFDALLGSLNIEHQFVVVPGIGHNVTLLYRGLGADAFAFYAKAWGARSMQVPPAH